MNVTAPERVVVVAVVVAAVVVVAMQVWCEAFVLQFDVMSTVIHNASPPLLIVITTVV